MSKVIVVTGSTRGIGYGLAHEFLKRDCRVVVNGRTQASVDAAVQTLSQQHNPAHLIGIAAEVNDQAHVQTLWDGAVARFGSVDIWINNAGLDIYQKPLWELPLEDIDRVIDVNMKGMVYGSYIALHGMLKQGKGTIYNMEGYGSSGMKTAGKTTYGSTKYALRYFTQSLQKEVKDTPVIVGTMSPGIVTTDMLQDAYRDRPEAWERAKKMFNILADTVETVTPSLVEQTLSTTSKTPKVEWLTTPKIFWRFLTAPITKRQVYT